MAKPTRYTPEMVEEYTRKGYWDKRTLSDLWKGNAKDHPHEEAIVDSKTRLTWKEANRWIDRLSLAFWELGLKRDDLIVIQIPNSVELCLLRIACERAGLLCLPVLRTWRQREMEYILDRLCAVGVVITGKFRDFDYYRMIEEIRPKLPKLKHVFMVGDDVPEGVLSVKRMVEERIEERYRKDFLEDRKCKAFEFSLIAATSGSTGFPKFIESPICSRIYMGRVFIKKFKLTQKDILGAFSPAVGGPNHPVYFSAPLVHAKVVMLDHFSSEAAFRLIEKEKITFASVVPAHLGIMIRDPNRKNYDLSSLRLFNCSGSPLSPVLARAVEEEFGCPIVQTYGSMDSGGMTLHSIDDDSRVRLFTVGKPADGNEVKLVNEHGEEVPEGKEGEILVKGPTLVSGYYKDPGATKTVWTDEGWYRTGDLGRFDEGGNLIIVGRKKDVIIRGGQNIYPVEIENLLLTHPKIANVAIVKMPDPLMGEKACAYVVLKEGQEFTFDEMVTFLKRQGIAAYKLPERMEIIDTMPMVAEGQKVDTKQLEKDIEEKIRGGSVTN